MKLKSFPKQTKSHLEKNMWFDGGVDIARYDRVKYPFFLNLAKDQQAATWGPEEIGLGTDIKNFHDKTMMPDHYEHIFTANLKRQILLDSIQGRSPLEVLLPICSLPELELWIIRWSAFEAIHSETYTYMIRALYNNPSAIFDTLRDIPEIEECARDVSGFYDSLANFKGKYGGYDHKRELWKCLNAINALEAVRFYVSFACTYAFGRNGILPGCADEIALINHDEELHRKGTTEMLKLMLREDDDYAKIRDEVEDEVQEMFVEVVEQECRWADYLFQHGGMLGLTSDLLKEYVRWIGSKRMKGVGLKSPYKVSQSHPLPWVLDKTDASAAQKSPQEEALTAYEKGRVKQDFDPSALSFDL